MSEDKCPVCEGMKKWLRIQAIPILTDVDPLIHVKTVQQKMAELEKEEEKEKREARKESWASVKGIFKQKECQEDSKEEK